MVLVIEQKSVQFGDVHIYDSNGAAASYSRPDHSFFLVIFVLFASAIGSVARGAANPEPVVVPAIRKWTGGEGSIPFQNCTIVVDPKSETQLLPIAQLFQQDMEKLGLGHVPISTGSASGLRFILALGDLPPIERPGFPDQAYTVDMGDAVRIQARTVTGVFYGTRTILQILEQNPNAPVLPRGSIVDYPSTRQRMLMLDVARKVYPYETLLDYLQMMAWLKMNELHLHLSDEIYGGFGAFRVECGTFPGLASKDYFYTRKQLRSLQDIAHLYGITITPEIDMPGHASPFTNYWPDLRNPKLSKAYLDVTNPQTVVRMEKLLDEIIPIFDAPDFHIGTDEYHVGGPLEEKAKFHEAFRQFINTMNAYIRTKGKTCRIWSGYEDMPGKTEIDPSVTIDMWTSNDAKGKIDQGHRIINSNQSWTYIVPGAHYYGVSNASTYNSWEPWRFSQDAGNNPAPDDPQFLGGKLHVWGDQGPTGYTMTEIADLVYPSMMVFAEKMWGRKGSEDYPEFQKRAGLVGSVPGVTVLNRIPCPGNDGIMLSVSGEHLLEPGKFERLAFAGQDRADLEYPWTLVMKVFPTGDAADRGVILSSDLMEICSDFSYSETKTAKDPTTGLQTKTKVVLHGVGLVRAAGEPGEDPGKALKSYQVSRVYCDPLPRNQWTTVSIVGVKGHTSVYIDGKLAGAQNDQMLCPLAFLGSRTGHSFTGRVKDLTVYNRAMSPKEIGRMAGLDIPDNLAAGCAVTASASDVKYGLTPEKITDEDLNTRWSSGPTSADQWIDIDLGAIKNINAVTIDWEKAFATGYRIAVSTDGQEWKEVSIGKGREGNTDASFVTTPARHIRILMSKPASGWGYSIFDVQAFCRKAENPQSPTQ